MKFSSKTYATAPLITVLMWVFMPGAIVATRKPVFNVPGMNAPKTVDFSAITARTIERINNLFGEIIITSTVF